jgi:hypothetical protein
MSDVLPMCTTALVRWLPFGPELSAIMLLRGELEYDAAQEADISQEVGYGRSEYVNE